MKITIDGKEIKQVTEFCYLGSLISDDMLYGTKKSGKG